MRLTILLFLSCLGELFGQKNSTQIDSLVAYYNHVAEHYLLKGIKAKSYYSIDSKGISMFASPQNKQRNKPEITVIWKDLPVFLDLMFFGDRKFQFDAYQKFGTSGVSPELSQTIFILKENHRPFLSRQTAPLSGIKIAIDPGHVAGDMATAKSEGRFVSINYAGKKYEFFEAELALTTAFVLRDSLIKYGAQVFLTRNEGNQSAFGKSYKQWLETDFRLILKRKGYNEIEINKQIKSLNRSVAFYKYFLDADLDARANLINYFSPDITVFIHYNADFYNTGWSSPTKRNYSMVFVPGSFLGGELYSREMRFDFLRLLVSPKTQKSVVLSELIMREFETQLKVPAVKSSEEPPYLKDNSLRISAGVYARNLRLNRLVNSVLCYGEPLLQDNLTEMEWLAQNDLAKGKISPRVQQVANAYLHGILNYVYQMKTLKP
jgi:N-acetylmuramoyl-L-alanine amidase